MDLRTCTTPIALALGLFKTKEQSLRFCTDVFGTRLRVKKGLRSNPGCVYVGSDALTMLVIATPLRILP